MQFHYDFDLPELELRRRILRKTFLSNEYTPSMLVARATAAASQPLPATSEKVNDRKEELVNDVPANGEPATGELALSSADSHYEPKWKLKTVISGHNGWVQAVAVEPDNQWFCTGSADRTIKVWDLASGRLKLTLTGHVMAVRALAVSDRMPYLFSAGDDKRVKCWDLESNSVVRDYHGHLSGVYTLSLHPTLNLLVTGGRDSVVRVWDIRTRAPVHVLQGHKGPVMSVQTQGVDPQIISGSQDSTVRLWDLVAGKSVATLTHHSKSVRGVALHPSLLSFASASKDAIKQWQLPEGEFLGNVQGHNDSIINTLAINEQGVLFAGGDDGSLTFGNYATSRVYQSLQTQPLPGSLASEAGILCSSFDQTGDRLITGESDKSIKIWGAV